MKLNCIFTRISKLVIVVQLLSCVWFFVTLWTAGHQASLSLTIFWSLLKLMSIESVKLSNHLILCQPFPASGSFPMSWLFTSGGQGIGASASALVLPMNIQGLFPLGMSGWISLLSKGLSRVFSSTTIQKHQFFAPHLLYCPILTSIHDSGKTIALAIRTFVGNVSAF